jgi:hypothetical protein
MMRARSVMMSVGQLLITRTCLSIATHSVLTITKAFSGFPAFGGAWQGLVKVDGTFT